MADKSKATDGPSIDDPIAWEFDRIPHGFKQFVSEDDIEAFARALAAPDLEPISDDASAVLGNGADSPTLERQLSRQGTLQREDTAASNASGRDGRGSVGGVDATMRERYQASHRKGSQSSLFISSKNDWAPVHEKVRRRREDKESGKVEKKRRSRRGKTRSTDETREGYLYNLLKWPLLLGVGLWVLGLSFTYLWTRLYIWGYEHFVSWRGTRHRIMKRMENATSYGDWVEAAKEMDRFLGNDKWREDPEFAYYDHKTVRRVLDSLRKQRRRTEAEESFGEEGSGNYKNRPVEELRSLVQACVKNNFVGVENSRLYSQTYYGTKNLVQEFLDEGTYPSPSSSINSS